jgi:hypothetical protein
MVEWTDRNSHSTRPIAHHDKKYGDGSIPRKQHAAWLCTESVAEMRFSECLLPGTTEYHDLFRMEMRGIEAELLKERK